MGLEQANRPERKGSDDSASGPLDFETAAAEVDEKSRGPHRAQRSQQGSAGEPAFLEAVRPRDVLRLARFAFAPGEVAQLEALGAGEALGRFYLLWTLKEACAKALGLPLLAALRECSFISEHQHWRASLPAGDRWSAGVWAPRPGLVLSVVVIGPAADTAGWCCREWPGTPADWPLLAGLGAFRATP